MKSTTLGQTKYLVEFVLNQTTNEPRNILHANLMALNLREGQLYSGIIEHSYALKLTSDQWFELLCILRTRILRSGLDLNRILSAEQLKRLPPAIG